MPIHECLLFQTRTHKEENPVCEGVTFLPAEIPGTMQKHNFLEMYIETSQVL